VGSADIQSLNDLGGSLHTAEETQLAIFRLRDVIIITAAALVPMIPLVLAGVPIDELIKGVGRMLFS
jgi:hypothetical protein